MALAPVEIRHTKLTRSLFGGYRKRATNEFLEQITESFEETWREREDLARQGGAPRERAPAPPRARGAAARDAPVGREVRDRAQGTGSHRGRARDPEAHTAARSITQDALAQRERLQSEAIRVRALLQAALTSVDESEHDRDREPVGAAAEAA